ncbi:MAG: zf-HC2 domain-containing protein [Acidobacteria bacterium]|nr:zf-HC2 domain-containing protein [Acidobacteriota bacterium]
MECRNVVDSLSEYLDGFLSDNEAGRIEGHLNSCTPCKTVRLELDQLRTAARELPLHTPPRALWTRISNEIEAELAAKKTLTTNALPKPGLLERLRAKSFTFTLPQLAGAGALALALAAFSSVSFYRQYNSVLTMRGMQTALFAEESQLKLELDRKMVAVQARMSNWNPQRRADFEQKLSRIEDSLQNCRQALKANPNDQAHQLMMRNLYQEKKQLLEGVE